MKNVLTILSIAMLSTTVHAENSINVSDTTAAQVVATEQVIAKDQAVNSLKLWEMLDTNKDGSLSKAEVASSEKVLASWDSLDANKDQVVSSDEFAKIFPLKN